MEITPIFSGGVGRSGTTIVARILKNHSRVFAGSPFEIKFVTEVHGLIDLALGQRTFLPTQISRKGYLLSKFSSKDPIKLRFLKFRKRLLNEWWIRTNRLGNLSGLHRALTIEDLRELLDELESRLDDPIDAARSFLFGYIRKHRKWQGEHFWIDTTPANIMYANFIHRIFPESKFIEMRRYAFDNIASVIKEPWGPMNTHDAILWWQDRILLANQAKQSIESSQFLTLELENLVLENREDSYNSLLKLLEVADESKMRNFFDSEVDAKRANIGRWQNDFEDTEGFQVKFASLVQSNLLKEFAHREIIFHPENHDT
jgi:hypothetical protein